MTQLFTVYNQETRMRDCSCHMLSAQVFPTTERKPPALGVGVVVVMVPILFKLLRVKHKKALLHLGHSQALCRCLCCTVATDTLDNTLNFTRLL